jgi:hypothetical protein
VLDLLDYFGSAVARLLQGQTGISRQLLVAAAGIALLFILVGVLILYAVLAIV